MPERITRVVMVALLCCAWAAEAGAQPAHGLVERLAEGWRWRELELPASDDVAEYVRVDGHGRPMVRVDGRMLRYEDEWSTVTLVPEARIINVLGSGRALAAATSAGLYLGEDAGPLRLARDAAGRPIPALRDCSEHTVADRVAVCVVHFLEPVEVEQHQADTDVRSFEPGIRLA